MSSENAIIKMNEAGLQYATTRSKAVRKELIELVYNQFFDKEDGKTYFFAGYSSNRTRLEYCLGPTDERFIDWMMQVIESYDCKRGATFFSYLRTRCEYRAREQQRGFARRQKRAAIVYDDEALDNIPDKEACTDQMTHALNAFGRLGEILDDQARIIEDVVRTYQREKPRYRVFYTRNYLCGVCPNFEIQSISRVAQSIDQGLSQPYILYLTNSTLENEEASIQRYSERGSTPVSSTELYRQWQRRGAIDQSRYEQINSINRYLHITNVTALHNRYRALVSHIFELEGIVEGSAPI